MYSPSISPLVGPFILTSRPAARSPAQLALPFALLLLPLLYVLFVLTSAVRRSQARPLLPLPPSPNPRYLGPPPRLPDTNPSHALLQQSDGDAVPRPRRLRQHPIEHRPL